MTRDRLLPPLLRRTRSAVPVPTTVVTVTTQALPPQPARGRPNWLPKPKARSAQPVVVVAVSPPQAGSNPSSLMWLCPVCMKTLPYGDDCDCRQRRRLREEAELIALGVL